MINMYKAAVLSLTTIMCWAMSNIFLRYCLLEYGCNQYAMACSNIVFCGLTMIALGSRNTDVWKIVKNYQTWLFGGLQIFRNMFMIMAFLYISSTQANLLANIEIVFSVLFAWFLFKRKPGPIDGIAMIFIAIGCFILLAGLPFDVMVKASLFVAISAFLNVLRTIIAEVYADNKANLSVKERLSMTGWIMFVSAMTFIIAAAILGFIVSVVPHSVVEALPFLKILPAPAEYIAMNNILSGLINGVCFYALSMYCYLYAVSVSNSEYFMMFRSTQAVFTYIVEVLVSSFTVLPFLPLTATDWLAAVTIILSSACMVLMRTNAGKQLRHKLARALHYS